MQDTRDQWMSSLSTVVYLYKFISDIQHIIFYEKFIFQQNIKKELLCVIISVRLV